MYLKIRYKDPDGTESKLIEEPMGSNINSKSVGEFQVRFRRGSPAWNDFK